MPIIRRGSILSLMSTVLLCDENGTVTGSADRAEAHAGKGKLHRAFSVFLFRRNGTEILIQRRSDKKALFPLLWANTCCSHLQEHETVVTAGKQRLREELGITCTLTEGPSFVYRAEDGERGSEYEYDTILTGEVTGDPDVKPDPEEVADWKWMTLTKLRDDMGHDPKQFAPWFILGLAMVLRARTPHA